MDTEKRKPHTPVTITSEGLSKNTCFISSIKKFPLTIKLKSQTNIKEKKNTSKKKAFIGYLFKNFWEIGQVPHKKAENNVIKIA
ncbi:MAG: hypothetical protein ACPKNR_04695 [Pleomorphochaeta sp.]